MQKFNYRAPRYVVDLPVRLTVEDSLVTGRCIEISREGMHVELRQPLPSGFRGMVSLSWQELTIELCARLAHATSRQAAMCFVFESEKERTALAEFITRVTAPRTPTALVLVR